MKVTNLTNVGIIGAGTSIPVLRLSVGEFAGQWNIGPQMERLYRLSGRNRISVAGSDEDVITLSIEAVQNALARLAAPMRASALVVGSETHPYAAKATAATVIDALGLACDIFAADVQFTCKSGTSAAIFAISMSAIDPTTCTIAVGADLPRNRPGTLLEASAGAAGAALVFGPDAEAFATVEAICSSTEDLTDFWRKDGEKYPNVVGKFSADEGYSRMTEHVACSLMKATGTGPADYAHVVFHQPYPSLPANVARKLGFSNEQLKLGLRSSRIGNSYSATCLLSLISLLEQAKDGDRILLVSFGSGCGSDGIVMTVKRPLEGLKSDLAKRYPLATMQVGEQHTTNINYGLFAHIQAKFHEV